MFLRKELMKKGTKKVRKEFHCPETKLAMGDFYGTGVRNPMGRIRDSSVNTQIPKGKLKTPPKALA